MNQLEAKIEKRMKRIDPVLKKATRINEEQELAITTIKTHADKVLNRAERVLESATKQFAHALKERKQIDNKLAA
jgi:hypothetical protein